MSAVVDVGDALELTFETLSGATVAATWLNPDGVTVINQTPVTENPAGTGQFPYTFLATAPGVWTARFTASGAATAVESYYIRASSPTTIPPLAAVGDVTAQFGPMTAAQEGITAWLIRAASAMVRFRFPNVDAHIAAGRIDPDLVALAVANMVLPILRNPRGLKAESTGPFSVTYDVSKAAGLLSFNESDLLVFVPPPVATNGGGVGTIMARPGLAPWPNGRTVVNRWYWRM